MTDVKTNETATNVNQAKDAASSLVDTLFDLGVGWAAHGLKIGKVALEQSAKTLEHTAKTLEGIAKELEKKDESATKAA
jgi:hypothetical protein